MNSKIKIILLLAAVGSVATFLATMQAGDPLGQDDLVSSGVVAESGSSTSDSSQGITKEANTNHTGTTAVTGQPGVTMHTSAVRPTAIPLIVTGKGLAGSAAEVTSKDQAASESSQAEKKEEAEDLFSKDDLDYLEDRGAQVNVAQAESAAKNQGSLYGGKRAGSRQTPRRVDEPVPEPIAEEEPTPAPQKLYSGHTRGYAMLYLMQPEARRTVERQLGAMIDSGVMDLYLAVLTDGTFGKNFTYLSSVITRLNQAGRTLTLVLYLTNGSTMRKFNTTSITAGFNRIDPKEFRDLIRFSPGTRDKFRRMVKEVRPIFELNQRLNPKNKNLVVPMLEDNLHVEAYKAMRDLIRLDLEGLASVMRNPCENCFPGNDAESLGDLLEYHAGSFTGSVSKAYGFSLDGEGYIFANEINGQGLTIREAAQLQTEMQRQGIKYFGLWRAARQGIIGGETPHPSERIYEVPSDEQLKIEEELLRNGLIEVTPDVAPGSVSEPPPLE